MKLVTISDTHGLHHNVKIPEGDTLIIAGDITRGTEKSAFEFNEWLGELPHKHKIMIAGNHDWFFEKHPEKISKIITNAIYLNESGYEIDGIKFWGSPWTPWFFDWAFNIPPGKESEYWEKIPDKIDVLITHGPPYNILDYVPRDKKHVGCKALLKRIKEIKPKYHIFGHIHDPYGMEEHDGTVFINTSICDESYNASYRQPWVVEI